MAQGWQHYRRAEELVNEMEACWATLKRLSGEQFTHQNQEMRVNAARSIETLAQLHRAHAEMATAAAVNQSHENGMVGYGFPVSWKQEQREAGGRSTQWLLEAVKRERTDEVYAYGILNTENEATVRLWAREGTALARAAWQKEHGEGSEG